MNLRAPVLAALLVAVLVTGCTSSTPDSSGTTSRPSDAAKTPIPGSGGSTAAGPSQPVQTTPGAPSAPTGVVTLASKDGSAFAGSRTVFVLRNTATGAVVTATVDGADAQTSSQLTVPAGTYAVTAADRFVGGTASWAVRDLAPAQVTVTSGTAATAASTVSFGLDVQRSPFDLSIENVTPNQIEVSWETLGSATISGYQLRRTDGTVPASAPGDGQAVELKDPAATSAVADGLSPDTPYNLTLFGTGADGQALAFRSVTVTTPKADASTPSYALAPNTIVPADFTALQAKALGDNRVQVVLAADNAARASTTAIPGVPTETLTGGCVPGLPFLASTEVAGENAFFGVVESCAAAPAWRAAATAPVTAVIDADVPLAAVMPYLDLHDAQVHQCIDENGTELAADAALCRGTDTDGDGMKDTAEKALGSDVRNPADGWQKFLTESKPAVAVSTGTTPPAKDLDPPAGLGSGEVQVTLLWATGDDLDLQVKDPAGALINYDTKTSASGGELDRDDQGDVACVATTTGARAENVFWKKDAPKGVYTVTVSNYLEGRQPCTTRPPAQLRITVGGKVVQEKVLTVGVDGAVTFTVGPPGWRAPAVGSAAGGMPSPHTIAPELSCEGVGQRPSFKPNIGFGEFHDINFKLKGASATWKMRAGMTVSVDPEVTMEAGVSCSLDFNVNTFQLMTTPVPINLELAPVVEGSATGKLILKGPKLDLTFGFKTEGNVSASIKTCGWGWFRVPCGISVDNKVTAAPIGDFSHGEASITGEAALSFGVGAEATLGVGIKNDFVTAKTGFALKLKPAVATAKISATLITAAAPATSSPSAATIGPMSAAAQKLFVEQLVRKATVRTDGSATGGRKVIGPLNTDPKYGICADGSSPVLDEFRGVRYQVEFARCDDATCVDEDSSFGTTFSTLQLSGSPCSQAKCIVTGEVITLSKDRSALVMCPQARVPIRSLTANDVPQAAFSQKPNYSQVVLNNIFLAQLKVAPTYIGFDGKSMPLVGPITNGVCTSGGEPVITPLTGGKSVYYCHDATCASDSKNAPIITARDACTQARCVVTGELVTTTKDGRWAKCDQGLVPTTPSSGAGTIKKCAKISLGAELGVDFRAETFVLGWGKDRRFPLYSKEFDYPGAKFDIGDCDD